MNPEEYHKLAEVEDRMWYFEGLHALVQREFREVLSRPGAAILDAGCGAGGLMRRLIARWPGVTWTGVDLEPLACELARARATPANIIQASVTALPFAEGSFDAIASLDVIYHVDDDRAALQEFFRVLRPGGRLVINVPAYRWLWSYHDVATHARRRYGRGELLTKLREAGFAGATATHWNTLPFPLVVARRKLLPAPSSGSDVQLFPAPVEAAFRVAMAAERAWLGGFGRLPFGSSLFAVAVKPTG